MGVCSGPFVACRVNAASIPLIKTSVGGWYARYAPSWWFRPLNRRILQPNAKYTFGQFGKILKSICTIVCNLC